MLSRQMATRKPRPKKGGETENGLPLELKVGIQNNLGFALLHREMNRKSLPG